MLLPTDVIESMHHNDPIVLGFCCGRHGGQAAGARTAQALQLEQSAMPVNEQQGRSLPSPRLGTRSTLVQPLGASSCTSYSSQGAGAHLELQLDDQTVDFHKFDVAAVCHEVGPDLQARTGHMRGHELAG